MSAAVKFTPSALKGSENHSITVYLPPSTSNSSWLTRRKNMAIGSAIGLGITVTAVTAYFLSVNNAFTETAFSSNTTETSTGFNAFAGTTTPSVNQSSLSLYNIAQLVETEPNYYANCKSAFQAHLEIFKICGKTLCSCIKNARDAFELHCLDYARNILKTPEECKETEFRIQRCLEREC